MTTYRSMLDILEAQAREDMREVCFEALDEVNAEIDALVKKGVLTNDLEYETRYNMKRLVALREEINKTLDTLSGEIADEVTGLAESSFWHGYQFSAYTINAQAGVSFVGVNKNLLRASVSKKIGKLNVLSRLKPERMELLWHERNAVAKAEAMGWGAKKTAAEIIKADLKQQVESSFARALRIARTEDTRNATEAASIAEQEAREAGVDCRGRWQSAQDERTRSTHRRLDGQVASVWNEKTQSYLFLYNGRTSAGPGQWGIPAMDINCRCSKGSVCIGFEEFAPEYRSYYQYLDRQSASSVRKKEAENVLLTEAA